MNDAEHFASVVRYLLNAGDFFFATAGHGCTIFDIAYCRDFSTLHRNGLLFYNSREIASRTGNLGNGPVVKLGSYGRGL